MNHPLELLADFSDGTLGPDDRARVDAHLRVCASCSDDLAAATAGRIAARSLPDRPPPVDLYERVVAGVGGRGDARQGPPGWYRWAGVAATAAVVVAIALALPDIGGDQADRAGSPQESSEVSTGGAETDAGAAPAGPEVQNEDYDEDELRRLAREAGRRQAATFAEGAQDMSSVAIRCVERALQGAPPGRLSRLIDARFEGRRAHIAVYLEGPGAGEPPDIAVAYVAATGECSILRIVQVLL